jgi:nucleoside-diphosphate-sugar epimerase
MKILLTGANGNFGRQFALQSAHEIVPFNRGDWGSLDEVLASGVDLVIHAASDLRSRAATAPAQLVDSNIAATSRLLEAVHRHGVPRFIFLSSCAVYGEDMRTGEEEKCCPISINGISKLLNEKIIGEYCSSHRIKFEILRVFNMYGGRDHFSILSHLQHALTTGAPFTLNNQGIAQRDFIHVADVARIVLRLIEKDVPYTHLNIGTGVATKISTLVELVAARFPQLSIRHAQVAEAEYSRADIRRLRQLVDIEFVRIEDYIKHEFTLGGR